MVGFLSGIAGGATVAIVIKGVDDFSKTFKKANLGIQGLKTIAIGATGALAGVGVAFGALGVSSLKAGADFEQTQVAFETMLGSAEEAKDFLEELANFAKKTPFTLKGVEQSAKQLMAVGFSAEEIMPTLKSIGDISAGLSLGEEGLQRLILNLGQVRNQGKLTGRELRDFAVAGVPLLDQLAGQLGKTTSEIQDMVSKGEITTDIVIQAFQDMTSEGGKFENLMAKQAETVSGKFSNLEDTFELLKREIGQALLPIVAEFADVLLEDVLPAVEPLIPKFIEMFEVGLRPILDNLPEMTEKGLELADAMIELFIAVAPLIPPLLDFGLVVLDLIVTAIKAVIPLINDLVSALKPVIEVLEDITGFVSKIFKYVPKITSKISGNRSYLNQQPTNFQGFSSASTQIAIENVYGVNAEDVSRSLADVFNTQSSL